MNIPGIALLFAMLLPPGVMAEDDLVVAVASNFRAAAEEIAGEFTKSSGVKVRISSGSTGALYAQIVNGAPYDVFLAADARRPQLLDEEALALSGSRTSYATGSLVLWSADSALAGKSCITMNQDG